MDGVKNFFKNAHVYLFPFIPAMGAELLTENTAQLHHDNEKPLLRTIIAVIALVAIPVLTAVGAVLSLAISPIFIPLRACLNWNSRGGPLKSLKDSWNRILSEVLPIIHNMRFLFPVAEGTPLYQERCEFINCGNPDHLRPLPARA